MGFEGGVLGASPMIKSAASPMIKSAKWWRRERRGLTQLEFPTYLLWGAFTLYSNFSLIIEKIIS